ncbi:hypothetical protein TYRP_015687, partial [Tyrophagus putrescentiae]
LITFFAFDFASHLFVHWHVYAVLLKSFFLFLKKNFYYFFGLFYFFFNIFHLLCFCNVLMLLSSLGNTISVQQQQKKINVTFTPANFSVFLRQVNDFLVALADANRVAGSAIFGFVMTSLPMNALIILMLAKRGDCQQKHASHHRGLCERSTRLKLHKPVKLVMGCSVQTETREKEEKEEKKITDGKLLHKRKLKKQLQNKTCRWPQTDCLKLDRYIATFHTERQFTVQYDRYDAVTFALQENHLFFYIKCIIFFYKLVMLKLLIFLFVQLVALEKVSADDGLHPPPPIASTNVNTVSAGTSFSGRNQRLFSTFLSDLIDKPYIASIQPVNSTITVTSNTFEISITTTKKTFSAQFFCYATYQGYPSADSNYVPITTIAHSSPPKPTLISSVSHVPLHHPFTLTCSLPSQFNPKNTAYQVAFLNSRDGLIADYKVDEHGKVFLSSKKFANVSAHLGARKSFPTFDLIVQKGADPKLSYWCQLLTVDSTTQKINLSLESAHWKPVGPFVDFNSAMSGSERRGRCSIDELSSFSGDREYQVLFYSDLGTRADADNLLGYFWVRPHDAVEFVAETVAHWASIVNGASVEYPHFEIVSTLQSSSLGAASSHRWWCALNFTESGQSSARLFYNICFKMLVKNTVKWFSLTIFLLFNLIANNQVLADGGPKPPPPIASTNVSTVSAGSAFTMKCEMPDNYTIGKEQFDMSFYYNINGGIADYIIPASTNGRNKRLFRTILNDFDKPHIASIQPVNSTTTVTSNTFEISITTTKKTFSAQFYCQAVYNGLASDFSNHVPITTTIFSPPTLISSVSHVPLHHPFTLTCSLPSQFNPNSSAYQVAFLNSRDGLIADYEIDASGRVTLVSKEHINSSAHLGTRAAFPTFDLEIREHVDRKHTHRIIEFVTETVTHWTSIVHGANINYPNFEIVTTLESNLSVSSNKWWCALNYTEPGQSSAKLLANNI